MVRRAAPTVLLGAFALTAALVAAAGRLAPREAPQDVVAPLAPTHAARDARPPASDAGPPESFVAFARDFEGFRGWERHAVDGAMMPIGAAPGPSFVYVNRRAPAGVRRWPVGTIFVKTIESGGPAGWTVHAMVKRGVPYNASGTVGWEFFELSLDDAGGVASVLWRGQGPPSGHGYAAQGRDAGPDPVPLVCNDCHGARWRNDGVLTPTISLLGEDRSP